VAAVVAVLSLHFGRAAVGGYVIADRSYGEDVYHISLLYERWAEHLSAASGDSVDVHGPARLFVSEKFHDGWTAEIDGVLACGDLSGTERRRRDS